MLVNSTELPVRVCWLSLANPTWLGVTRGLQ